MLEHIPTYVAVVIWHFHRALKDGGKHLFCIPVMRGSHASDFNELSDEERTKLFGQKDHVRRFGDQDINATLGSVLKLDQNTSSFDISNEIADQHCINANEVKRTIFLMGKDDILLSSKH